MSSIKFLNAEQEREYNRDVKLEEYLLAKKAEYEAYAPFNKVVQLLLGNIARIEPLTPGKGKKGIPVTKRKDALKSSLADDVNVVCLNATEYAVSIGNEDLIYAVRFRTRHINGAKDGNVTAIVTTITDALTPLLSNKEFQEYQITAETLDALTKKAQAFNDTRGKAAVIDTDSSIANGDLNEVFKAIRANIASLRRLITHFNISNPNFVSGFHTSAAVDHSGLRHSGIEGIITNPLTGGAIEGATITGEGKSKIAITDSDGTYKLIRLKIGSMKITVTAPGYDPQVFDVKILRGKILELNVSLKGKLITLSATA